MSLTADPPAATVPAAGGTSTHTLANGGAAKIVFKVKCSNNNNYRLKPVFGFVDAGASSPLEVTRTAGDAKEDKLVVQYGNAPDGETDARRLLDLPPLTRPLLFLSRPNKSFCVLSFFCRN